MTRPPTPVTQAALRSRRRRRRARALLALWTALLAGAATPVPTVAEDPPESEAPAPTAAPAPPAAFPLAEVAAEREATGELLRRVESDVRKAERAEAARAELPERARAIGAQQARADALLDDSATLDELREIESGWRALRTSLEPMAAALTDRVEELDAHLSELEELEERWKLTLAEARKTNAPAAVVQGVASTLAALEETDRLVAKRRSELLSLQTQVGTQEARVSAALDVVQRRRETAVTQVFSRSAPALWSKDALSGWRAELENDLPRSLEADRLRIVEFSSRRATDLALYAAAFLALLFALQFVRRRFSKMEGDVPSSLHVLEHPLSLGFVLALLPLGWFFPEMPLLMRWLLFVAVLPAMIVIARDYTEPSLRPTLYALGFFILLDLVRELIAPLSALSRLAFAAEMALVALFVAWLLRPARLATLSSGEQLRGLHAAGVAARIAFGACVLAGLLELLGFVRLAHLLGDGVLRSAYAALFLYAASQAVRGLGAFLLRRRPLRMLRMVSRSRARIEDRFGRILSLLAAGLWVWAMLDGFALWQPLAKGLGSALAADLEVGEVSLSLGDVVTFGVTLALAFGVAGAIRLVLNEEVFPRIALARGVPYAISTLVGYAVLFAGFLFAAAAAGVDFTRFTLLAGAFGVGIGFGLQNVVNNFVSGLILLFERPIQVGDTLQLGEVSGEVRHIGIRASTVRTWEGADVVVPNGDLIAQNVTNWTLADRNRRIDLPVGVAYGSDPRAVVDLLLEVAKGSPDVLAYPPVQALFLGFGDSSLDFMLRFWTGNAERWVAIRSEIALDLHDALRDAGFEIPFPQRDLHVRSLPPGAFAAPTAPAAPPERGQDD